MQVEESEKGCIKGIMGFRDFRGLNEQVSSYVFCVWFDVKWWRDSYVQGDS